MQVSNCCGAKLKLMPTDKLIEDKTYWYECTKCNKPCDGVKSKSKSLDDIEECKCIYPPDAFDLIMNESEK